MNTSRFNLIKYIKNEKFKKKERTKEIKWKEERKRETHRHSGQEQERWTSNFAFENKNIIKKSMLLPWTQVVLWNSGKQC